MAHDQTDEQDWRKARDLAEKLEDAIDKAQPAEEHARNLIRHIRRITPAPRRRATSADDM